MSAEAMSKKLYEELVAAGATQVTLGFSGGSDEGFLDVSIDYKDTSKVSNAVSIELERKVEKWAWTAYRYSGAGDGSEYGDNYIYNLVDGTVEHSSWYTERVTHDGDGGSGNIEFSD